MWLWAVCVCSDAFSQFMWPAFCDATDDCVSCITSGRGPIGHALLHLSLFYCGALGFAVARRLFNLKLRHLRSAWNVAWHVPNIITCLPMGLHTLRSFWTLAALDEDRAAQFGPITDPIVVEAGVWFFTFLCVDTVLMVAHGFVTREILLHHAIFGAVCYFLLTTCSTPFVAAALLSQELSTPFLNVFLLLREFKGMGYMPTQVVFVLFALTFFATRVCINGYATCLYVSEVLHNLHDASSGAASPFVISVAEQIVLALVLLGGLALQINWAVTIAKKIQHAIAGGASPDHRKEA